KSLPLPPPPSRSRSSLPPNASTRSGSVVPSWPPCPPSSRCGSPSRNTTKPAQPSSTESASKHQACRAQHNYTIRVLLYWSPPSVPDGAVQPTKHNQPSPPSICLFITVHRC